MVRVIYINQTTSLKIPNFDLCSFLLLLVLKEIFPIDCRENGGMGGRGREGEREEEEGKGEGVEEKRERSM